jgi:hypothetical protein
MLAFLVPRGASGCCCSKRRRWACVVATIGGLTPVMGLINRLYAIRNNGERMGRWPEFGDRR